MLPEYGTGFLVACLEHYAWDAEQVINSLLEGSLPAQLKGLDRQAARLPHSMQQPSSADHQWPAAQPSRGKALPRGALPNITPPPPPPPPPPTPTPAQPSGQHRSFPLSEKGHLIAKPHCHQQVSISQGWRGAHEGAATGEHARWKHVMMAEDA